MWLYKALKWIDVSFLFWFSCAWSHCSIGKDNKMENSYLPSNPYSQLNGLPQESKLATYMVSAVILIAFPYSIWLKLVKPLFYWFLESPEFRNTYKRSFRFFSKHDSWRCWGCADVKWTTSQDAYQPDGLKQERWIRSRSFANQRFTCRYFYARQPFISVRQQCFVSGKPSFHLVKL